MKDRNTIKDRRKKLLSDAIEDIMREGHRKASAITTSELSITCRRSAFDNCLGRFKCRDVHLIISLENQEIAVASFTHWKLKGGIFLSNEEFLESADCRSATDLEMAELLAQYWDDLNHPFDFGDLVHFDRLIIRRPHPEIWSTIRSCITKEFGRNTSIILLKPFPLEWEIRAHGTDEITGYSFEQRQAAMIRLYSRQLGAECVEGSDGNWMWAPLRVALAPNASPSGQWLSSDY